MKLPSAQQSMQICAAILCATMAVCTGLLTFQVRGVITENRANAKKIVEDASVTSETIKGIAEANKSKINQMIRDAGEITRDGKIVVRGQKDEWQSPEWIRWRKDGFRAGEQLTVAIGKFTDNTLPRIDALIDHSSDLVTGVDKNLNEQFLPNATLAVKETTAMLKSYGVTAAALNRAVEMFAEQGKIVMEDAHALLVSPEWKSMLANLDQGTKSLAGTMNKTELFMGHIEEAGREAPGMARDLHNISYGASKTARLFSLLRVVGALAPVAAVIANR